MIKFIIYLLLLILAVWAGVKIAVDPGFAIFAYQHWTVEMPLWFFGLALVVLFLLVYMLIAFLKGTSRVSKHIKMLNKQHKLAIAHRKTSKGLLELAEGNWEQAEKLLIKGASYSAQPLINYLAAARAAHEQSAYERRDEYLRVAHETTPDAKIAVGLTQAELQISHQQLEHSLATLRHLQNMVPQQAYVLKLLKDVYEQLGDWQALLELLPELGKRKVVKPEALKQLEIKAYQGLFGKVNGLQITLDKVWDQVPKRLRREKAILIPYVKHLLSDKDYVTAEAVVRDVLKHAWDGELVALYGETKFAEPDKQLAYAEAWLKSHGNSPALLLCLARLAKRCQLWGKAKDYLQTSISIDATRETYAELANLYEELGETDNALQAYRDALAS